MYKIELYLKNIIRHHTPANRELDDKIIHATKTKIGTYYSDSVPNIGDIIWYSNNEYYDVIKVIRNIRATSFLSKSEDLQSSIFLEVRQHSNKEYHNHGSDAWYEDVPLVTEIITEKELDD